MEKAWCAALYMSQKYGEKFDPEFDLKKLEVPADFVMREVDWEYARAQVRKEYEQMKAPATKEIEDAQLDRAMKESLLALPPPTNEENPSVTPAATPAGLEKDHPTGEVDSTPGPSAAKDIVDLV